MFNVASNSKFFRSSEKSNTIPLMTTNGREPENAVDLHATLLCTDERTLYKRRDGDSFTTQGGGVGA
jgi:hypothetical protein